MALPIDLQTLKERIAEKYDPDYIADMLNISSLELLDRFEEKLLEKVEEFSDVEDPE